MKKEMKLFKFSLCKMKGTEAGHHFPQKAVINNTIKAYFLRYAFYLIHLIVAAYQPQEANPLKRFIIAFLILIIAEFFYQKKIKSLFYLILINRVLVSIIYLDRLLYTVFDPEITYSLLLHLFHINQIYYLTAMQVLCFIYVSKKMIAGFFHVIAAILMMIPYLYVFPGSDHQIVFILKAFGLLNFALFMIFKQNKLNSYTISETFLMILYGLYSLLMVISDLGFIRQLDEVYDINIIYAVVLMLVLFTLKWKERFILFITKKALLISLLMVTLVLIYLQSEQVVFLIQSLSFLIITISTYVIYRLALNRNDTT